MGYDVFISYRREAFESANLIAEKLRSAGYTVFFDLETLREGKFNEQLLTEIEHCTDFLVVLPQGGLDRCVSPEDWVRREVCHAMLHGKNIIPVMLSGFQWPMPMPEGMEELSNYQAITATSREYFDLSMKRLMGYLHSKPHRRHRKVLLTAAGLAVALAVCVAIVYYSFRLVSIPVCTEVAGIITKGMGVMNLLGADNQAMQQEWDDFHQRYGRLRDSAELVRLKAPLYQAIDHYRREIDRLAEEQPVPVFDLSHFRLFLLGLYDINAAELQAFSETYQSMFRDLRDGLDTLKARLDRNEFSQLAFLMTENSFRGYQHALNMLYYGYLETLSLFPEKARELHRAVSQEWNYYPNGVGLDLPAEEYQRFQQREANAYEQLLKEVEMQLTKTESDVDALEQRLDHIENMVGRAASSASAASRQGEPSALTETRESSLAKKQAYVEAQRKKLSEIDEQYEATYLRLLEKCRLQQADESSYMWGKLVHWATFMATLADNRKKTEAQGIRLTSVVTPERALEDMNTLLASYQAYHPEAAAYLPAVRAFYGLVARGERPLSGVLVFGFKDDAVHPLLQAGDIVVSRNGRPVSSYADLQKALASGGDGSIVFLRMDSSGMLEEHRTVMPDTRVLVGYLDLKE